MSTSYYCIYFSIPNLTRVNFYSETFTTWAIHYISTSYTLHFVCCSYGRCICLLLDIEWTQCVWPASFSWGNSFIFRRMWFKWRIHHGESGRSISPQWRLWIICHISSSAQSTYVVVHCHYQYVYLVYVPKLFINCIIARNHSLKYKSHCIILTEKRVFPLCIARDLIFK